MMAQPTWLVYILVCKLKLRGSSPWHFGTFIRDALQWVHELGSLSKVSRKFKATFSAAVAASEGPSASLRPLCPTRWTVRGPAVRAVLS